MATTIAVLVKKRCAARRAAGLLPVRIRVPSTRRPGFAAECMRQSKIASQADMNDSDLLDFMDQALADVDGWTA